MQNRAPNFAIAVDPPSPPGFHLLPDLRRATDQRCWTKAAIRAYGSFET